MYFKSISCLFSLYSFGFHNIYICYDCLPVLISHFDWILLCFITLKQLFCFDILFESIHCSIYLRIYLSPCQALNYFLFLIYRIFPQVSKYSTCSIYILLPPQHNDCNCSTVGHTYTHDLIWHLHMHTLTHVWFHRLKSAWNSIKVWYLAILIAYCSIATHCLMADDVVAADFCCFCCCNWFMGRSSYYSL